jgi:hypothetical protein
MSPIKLAVEIISPLGEEDRELLSGIAVMTLAIANHELAKAKFPEAFTDDDGLSPEEPVVETVEETVEAAVEETVEETVEPARCGLTDGTRVCIAKAGHRGRHAMREVALPLFPN